jgi:hypothetical protein
MGRLEEIRKLVDRGFIHLGMSRDELRSLLGDPDDVGAISRKYEHPSIWKYGEVEFFWPLAKSARQAQEDGLELVMVDGWEDGPDPIILLQVQSAT